ncbi:ribose-5-phosphate isomerase [Mucor mucedo]|uniref:ribose-5-phosphate isomerase n=1 Tax=Mucor mucedo TaxID=29922 RepID=UPI00221FCBE1|nr:ribose-5-phosphate isomerase [Mucor mucedo]KAI7891488.1 ribose-5-phosphate isomerase [Mucor mucedo]
MLTRKSFAIFKRHSSSFYAEASKKWAGTRAMQELVQSKPSVVGLGSGSTIVYAIEHLAKTDLARTVTCIPTSFQTRQLILAHSLKLGSLEQYPIIDITIDGADEIDPRLNAIKGGGACLFQERLVAQSSRRFLLVADATKKSKKLGTQWRRGVPVEVVPLALNAITYSLQRIFPDVHIQLRMATPTDKAGPVVTDNGNLILDCDFGPIDDPVLLYKEIKCLSGILDVGLFCKMAEAAYIGDLKGDEGVILTKD